MTVPYQPEPGCSAVQRQQAQQIHELRQQLKTAEDELRQQREQAVQHRAAMARVEAELAGLREGEEPYEDKRTIPTPAQWLWRWNRSTSAERLDQAARVMDRSARLSNAYQALIFQMGHPDWAQAVHDALTGKPYEPRVQKAPRPTLQARLATPVIWCDQCTRSRHPGYTCDEIGEHTEAVQAALGRLYEQAMKQPHLGAAFIAPDASEPKP